MIEITNKEQSDSGLEFDYVRKQVQAISKINSMFVDLEFTLFEGFAILNNIYITRLGLTDKLTREQKYRFFQRMTDVNLGLLQDMLVDGYDVQKVFKEVKDKIGEENTMEFLDKLNKSYRINSNSSNKEEKEKEKENKQN